MLLELAGTEKPEVVAKVETRQLVENGVQVSFEEEIITINGNGTHLTNGIKESPIVNSSIINTPMVNGINEKVLIDVVKEQIVVDENMQLMIDNKQEVCLKHGINLNVFLGDFLTNGTEMPFGKWNPKVAK